MYPSNQDFQTWRKSGELSDLTVDVDGTQILLHSFPMYVKSEYFKQQYSVCKDQGQCVIKLTDFPGGPDCFETVADFCYGLKPKLNKDNAVAVRCAANILAMEKDGNLSPICDKLIDDLLKSSRNMRSTNICLDLLSDCEKAGQIAETIGIVEKCISALIDCMSMMTGRQQMPDTLSSLNINMLQLLLESARQKNTRTNVITDMVFTCLYNGFCRETDEPEEDSHPRAKYSDEDKVQILDGILLSIFTDESKSAERQLLIERITPELAVRLLSESERLKCDVKDDLKKVCGSLIPRLKTANLAQLPSDIVAEMIHVDPDSDMPTKQAACKTADSYLKALSDNKQLDAETFSVIMNAAPNEARTSHDQLFTVLDSLLQDAPSQISEDERDKLLKSLDLDRCSETTLTKMHESKLLPTECLASAALKLCAKLRQELDRAQSLIGAQDQQIKRSNPMDFHHVRAFGDELNSSNSSLHDTSLDSPYHFKPSYQGYKKSPTAARTKYSYR